MLVELIIYGLAAITVCIGLIAAVIPKKTGPAPPTVLIFLGSGGHTGEMLRITENLDLRQRRRLFVVGQGDSLSVSRARDLFPEAAFETIPRARQVGEPLWRAVPNIVKSIIAAVRIIAVYAPHLVILNGPGTCVPLVLACYILKPLGGSAKLLYIESFARVETLSLTGKMLYRLVDRFIVQWPDLQRKYPKSEYMLLV